MSFGYEKKGIYFPFTMLAMLCKIEFNILFTDRGKYTHRKGFGAT
jgi:hypothetical protein